jgi:hypothetical protein
MYSREGFSHPSNNQLRSEQLREFVSMLYPLYSTQHTVGSLMLRCAESGGKMVPKRHFSTLKLAASSELTRMLKVAWETFFSILSTVSNNQGMGCVGTDGRTYSNWQHDEWLHAEMHELKSRKL